MQASIKTVAFVGISAIEIDVQIQIINGLPAFTIVGLPDKAVAESRERIRASLFSMGISLPSKRITVNLAPADVQKEGSHYDLPIALALLVSMEILSQEDINNEGSRLASFFLLPEEGSHKSSKIFLSMVEFTLGFF